MKSPEIVFGNSELGEKLLQMIKAGTAAQQRVADYLLRHPIKVTGYGIDELAEQCGVSSATVSRFVRDLGLGSYADLRAALAEVLQSGLNPVEKLRNTIQRAHVSPAQENFDLALQNLALTSQLYSADEFRQVVQKIIKAKTIYVLGFGLSAHMAGLLVQHLQPYCSHVVEVVGIGGTEVAIANLLKINSRDVMIPISLPRYTGDAVRLTRFARDRGACIISITDALASPLAPLSDHVLLAKSEHAVLPSSATGVVCLIEALTASVMASRKENLDQAKLLTEAIANYMYS